MPSYDKHFGRIRDDDVTGEFISKLRHQSIKGLALAPVEKRAVFGWDAIARVKPNWRRIAQEIGDCVSFGAEICLTVLMAQQALLGKSKWIEEAATEPIYGGGRVEIHGRPQMGYNEDGSIGAWGAEWCRDYGCLCRIDYSETTKNPDHDLRKYTGKRAKDWGYYGNGGKDDKGELDKVARMYPVKDIIPVRTVEELEQALLRNCMVSVASMRSYGNMKRNSDGIVRTDGDNWPHQMAFWGIDYLNGEPMFHQCQSWGKSCSGPYPGVDWKPAHDCSWRTTPDDAQKQLNEGDSFAYSYVDGLPQDQFDWANDLLV